MKTLIWLASLSILVLSSTIVGQSYTNPALFAHNYLYFGSGARAMAMGNAFVGLANDVNGGTWNPAGIWTIEGPMMSTSYNIYVPNGDFTQTLNPTGSNAITSNGKNDVSLNALGHFSFVTPVRIKGHPFVFNVNYNRSNEYSLKAVLSQIEDNQISPDTWQEDKVYLQTFNFGFSTRIYSQLSIGCLFDYVNGKRVIKTDVEYGDDIITGGIQPDTVALHLLEQNIDTVTSNGFNITLGMMYKMDQFNLGAVVHTPFTMTHSTDRGTYTVLTLNGLPNVNNSDTVYVNDALTKQQIPLSAIVGIAYLPSENISMTLDAYYQDYGSTNWYNRTSFFFDAGGDRTDFYDEVPIEWNNSFGIGGGIEYLKDSKFGRIPLRAGVRYNQLPQSDEIVTGAYILLDEDDQQTENLETTYSATGRQSTIGISVGAGIHWSQIELDFAYRYTFGAEVNIEENIGLKSHTGEIVTSSVYSRVLFEDKIHEMRLTFTGYF